MKNNDAHKDFLEDFLSQPNLSQTPTPVLPKSKIKTTTTIDNKEVVKESNYKITKPILSKNINDKFFYEDVLFDELPFGKFYYVGTRIQFREISVKEAEHFSSLDETSIIDFKNKLNDILERCVIYEHPDGTPGTYLDIFEGDRPWLIYLIREKSFPQGKSLTIKVEYVDNNEKKEGEIELLRMNIEKWSNDERIWDYFDEETKTFIFETTLRDEPYYLGPPTIGLKLCFQQYAKIKIDEGIKINEQFFIMMPWLNPHLSYLPYEELDSLYNWFEYSQKIDEFSFLDDLMKNHLKIGIKGLKKNVEGRFIFTSEIYPRRRKDIFIVPNAFGLFLRK